MIDLSNRVALVTGGSRGIGAAIAVILAKAGADVAVLYRNDTKSANTVVNRIKKFDRNGFAVRGDIEDYNQCKFCVGDVVKKLKRIDILVNNAAIWECGEIGKMTHKQWQKTIDINLTGTFNMCNIVVPIMKKHKYGKIINIASTAGQRGEAFYSQYAASKGGVIAFTKSIAAELIKTGIWVNCVAPGWIKTDMVMPEYQNLKTRKEILRSIPRGKIGLPDEIAGPVLFLSSSLADNVVGEILNVNGGSVLYG